MQKRSTKNSEKDKPSWDWMQVQCSLKINQSNKKSVVWNLAPTIILTNPTSQYSDPNVRLYIDTQKSLQYSPQLGWNWHKSWNLPNISLRLQIKDQNSGQQLLAPKNLYAQMFAVKKSTDTERTQHMSLIDVGIRGDGKMQMIDGQVYFSAMKFSSTTYNNEGMNFNLLIVLYIHEDGVQKPKILTAVMSPGIFVDSRRSARDYQEKKFNSFIEPFLYENLEKQYIKRQNKSKTQSQIIIKNDPEGFYNYLTAPNIRHKVKHPIFLAIKFSNCVQILYNTDQLDNMNTKLLIQNLQKKLLKQNKTKFKNQNGFLGSPNDKTFIFLVQNMNDSLKKKKVMESIQTMENAAIGIIYDRKQLTSNFVSIGQPETLTKAYRESYQNLVQQCKKYEPSSSEEESSQQQQQAPSEKSYKKIKLDEYPKVATRSNNTNVTKKPLANGFLKKQEEDIPLQQPKFFPPTLDGIGSKKGSAFNRAVGFKNIQAQNNNQSCSSHNQMNKNNSPVRVENNNSILQNDQNVNNSSSQPGQNKNIQNLICNNLMLSNWLNSVKNNNVNLYDAMTGNNVAQHLINQGNADKSGNRTDQRNPQNPYQVNEQLQCLMQQINLYRQLLAQITYQNALLGGRTFPNTASNPSLQPAQMNYPPQLLHNMLSSISGLGGLGVGLGGLPQLQTLGGLGLGGLNLGGMNNSPNFAGQGLNNPPNLGANLGVPLGGALNGNNLGSQAFGTQGLNIPNGLGSMIPNLQALQTLHTLQSLGGLMNPGSMSTLQGNTQIPSNMNLNDILRNQMEQQNKTNQQDKRGRQDKK